MPTGRGGTPGGIPYLSLRAPSIWAKFRPKSGKNAPRIVSGTESSELHLKYPTRANPITEWSRLAASARGQSPGSTPEFANVWAASIRPRWDKP